MVTSVQLESVLTAATIPVTITVGSPEVAKNQRLSVVRHRQPASTGTRARARSGDRIAHNETPMP